MNGVAKTGDMSKTKADCIAYLKKLYPDIKDSDMKTIVHSIFNLLNVTDKVEAQHAKKRSPRKKSEKQKENQREKNAKKKAERQQREEAARQGKAPLKEYEESSQDRHTPRGSEAQEAGWHVDTHR